MKGFSTQNLQKSGKCRKAFFSLLLLISFAFSIDFAKAQNEQSWQSFVNVSYKKTPSDSAIMLDIFLPDSNSLKKYPVLLIIHSGGWVEGDKELETIYYMQRLKSELLNNGFAVISIDYRLVGKNVHLPTPIEDCKDAIRWVRAHSEEYRFDTSNIGLWGGSAGGHLALMAAYTTNDEFVGDKKLSSQSARVNYVIDNFGPANLNSLFRIDLGGFTAFLFKLFSNKLYQIREQLVFAMTGYQLKEDKKKNQ